MPIEDPVMARAYLRRAQHSRTHIFTCTIFDRRWRTFLEQEEEAVMAKHYNVDAAVESLFALPSDSNINSVSEECSCPSSGDGEEVEKDEEEGEEDEE